MSEKKREFEVEIQDGCAMTSMRCARNEFAFSLAREHFAHDS